MKTYYPIVRDRLPVRMTSTEFARFVDLSKKNIPGWWRNNEVTIAVVPFGDDSPTVDVQGEPNETPEKVIVKIETIVGEILYIGEWRDGYQEILPITMQRALELHGYHSIEEVPGDYDDALRMLESTQSMIRRYGATYVYVHRQFLRDSLENIGAL